MKVRFYAGLCAVSAGLVILLATSAVQAQGQDGRREFRGPGGFGFQGQPGGMDAMRLLGIEQVQKEIKLNEDQKGKIEALIEQLREEGRQHMQGMGNLREEMQKLSDEERRKKFEELMRQGMEEQADRAKKNMEKLAEILDAEQLKRVKQIQLQLQGVAVLLRPEVLDHIGLDDAQKQQLKEIAENTRSRFMELMPRGERDRSENREAMREAMQNMREKFEEIRGKVEKESMAVLTAEQKQKLAEMMGEPFELDRSAFDRRDRRGDNSQGEGRRDRNRRDRNRQGGDGQQ